MKRNWPLILWLSLTAFGIYALTTGGVVVSVRHGFEGRGNIRLVEGLESDVWLLPNESRFGIPFVFRYYRAEAPFGLRLQIWDESKEYRAVEVTEIVVEYTDGEVVRKTEAWSRQLEPYKQWFMLSARIEGLAFRHTDLKITLKGVLVKANGERVAFDASASFKARSSFHLDTYWAVLASA